MKRTTIVYIFGFIISMMILFGGYIITSFVIKTYTILQEENAWIDVKMVAKDASEEDISRMLLVQWLEIFEKRKYVSAIEKYTVHSIKIEEEHETYFVFSSKFSVFSNDPETSWKNLPHTEHDGLLTFDRTFRVNKVGDTYYFRTVVEATDGDFAQ